MKVSLRPVKPEDILVFYGQHSDPAAIAMAGVPLKTREAYVAHWIKIMADPLNTLRAIEADGAVAGHALCWPKDGRRWVGYWVDRALWGRGIARSALRQLLELESSRPLFAETSDTNVRSQLVLRNSGFIEVERKPGSVTWRIG